MQCSKKKSEDNGGVDAEGKITQTSVNSFLSSADLAFRGKSDLMMPQGPFQSYFL